MRVLAVICLGSMLCALPAAGAPPSSPFGRWLSEDAQGVVTVTQCATDICGILSGVTLDHPSDPLPTDWRGAPQCGDLLFVAAPDAHAPQTWEGHLQDPRNGHIWNAIITMEHGLLQLHGYFALPLFGETQDWTRFTGHIGRNCVFTPPAAAPAPPG